MKKKGFFTVPVFFFAFSFLSCIDKAGGQQKGSTTKDENGFAVVELFTSEGCSSCPPADQLMAKLLKDYKDNVYVLSFHVDYWNRLGWTDRFSDAAYTARQNLYAETFHLTSIYTPQAIVNGSIEFVGSDQGRLYSSINEQLKKASGRKIKITANSPDSKTITVSYTASVGKNESINIALVQLQAETKVKGGENGGRTLSHVRIVRDFKSIEKPLQEGTVTLTLPNNLTTKEVSIVAFVQDRDHLQVTAADGTDVK